MVCENCVPLTHFQLLLLLVVHSVCSRAEVVYHEEEPNDIMSTSNKVAWLPPFYVLGNFQQSTDQDWYNVSITVSGDYVIQTFSPDCKINDGLTDTELEVWLPNSTRLRYDDDSGAGSSSKCGLLAICNSPKAVMSWHLVCEATDCQWTAWGAWGDCSVKCAGGVVTRTRTATFCDNRQESQTLPCNTVPCSGNSTVCSPGEWSRWSDCDHNACKSERWRAKNEPVPYAANASCSTPFVELETKTCECLVIAVETPQEMEKTFWVPIRIEGYLQPDEIDYYHFYFPSAGSYTIQTMSACSSSCDPSTDTILSLLSNDKSVLNAVDDTGNLAPCDELVVTLPDKGNYWIAITSFNSYLGVGRYALVVRPTNDTTFNPSCLESVLNYKWPTGSPPAPPADSVWRTLCVVDHPGFAYETANDLREPPFYVTHASFTEGQRDYYFFQITSDDHYTFQTLSPTYRELSNSGSTDCWKYSCNVDTLLVLRDQYGTEITRNDDSFERCSQIGVHLTPGFYFLVVSSFDLKILGEYSLIGIRSNRLTEAIGWCNGASPSICIADIHPLWISLLIALVAFIVLTLALAVIAHLGRSFYSPMNPIRTDTMEPSQGQSDDKAVELDDISSD